MPEHDLGYFLGGVALDRGLAGADAEGAELVGGGGLHGVEEEGGEEGVLELGALAGGVYVGQQEGVGGVEGVAEGANLVGDDGELGGHGAEHVVLVGVGEGGGAEEVAVAVQVDELAGGDVVGADYVDGVGEGLGQALCVAAVLADLEAEGVGVLDEVGEVVLEEEAQLDLGHVGAGHLLDEHDEDGAVGELRLELEEAVGEDPPVGGGEVDRVEDAEAGARQVDGGSGGVLVEVVLVVGPHVGVDGGRDDDDGDVDVAEKVLHAPGGDPDLVVALQEAELLGGGLEVVERRAEANDVDVGGLERNGGEF